MISQNIEERTLNITSILSNLKCFIKKVYQKEWTQNINKKMNQKLRAGASQKVENNLHLNRKAY